MRREVFAFIAGPLALAVILLAPPWAFYVLATGFVCGAMVELAAMARHAGIPAPSLAPAVAVGALVAAGLVYGAVGVLVVLGAVITVLPLLQLAHPDRPRGALEGSAVGVFGTVYFGVGALGLCAIRQFGGEAGGRLVLWSLLLIWFGDAGAYYVGKAFGKHKMAPRVSPKKSWEGLAGGVATQLVVALVARLILVPWMELGTALLAALLIGVLAPLGDLVESLYKRSSGVKDSSALIPGHGGLFDRCDSIVLTGAPLFALFWLLGVFE